MIGFRVRRERLAANKDSFRKAWGKFPTGVTVITTLDDKGEVHAMTANGVVSVSLEPLLNLLSVGHHALTLGYLQKSRRYGMSFLAEGQQDIGVYYAKRPGDRTAPAPARFTKHGESYKVEGALAYFDCKVVATHDEGDHILFVSQVEEIEVSDGMPLIFYDTKWHTLPPPPVAAPRYLTS
jgi:flavin reductase (DIM6/NTAB) family NADH-FMN oxidoreductase RutF